MVANTRLLGLSVARVAAALGLLLFASAIMLRLPREQLLPLLPWVACAHLAAACLFLPRRTGAWLFLLAVGIAGFLAAVNSIKAGLTGLPLTMLDLRIALANPAGLWDSLNLPRWTLQGTLVAIGVVTVLVLGTAAAALRRHRFAHPPAAVLRHATVRLGGLLCVALVANANLERMYQQLSGYRGTWEPQGLVAMAAKIGVVPFLAYSHHVEGQHAGDFFRADLVGEPPEPSEINASALKYINFSQPPRERTSPPPNIVVLLAESTFDPNSAFRLSKPVESSLFRAAERTAAVGPLRVNVVGGGTWVTEFETITGLDSRLFGYAGYYTHSSLAPHVRRTLASGLAERGYRTLAVLPHEGEFYNYRNAYRAYGFEQVVDSRDRGWAEGWRHSDYEIAQDVIRLLGPAPAAPFFAYVALVENHGPHDCQVAGVADMPVQFAETRDFEPNCALHEYLRRLQSTAAATTAIENYLRALESRDGRPYVLLVYGDHQPFTFTGTGMVRYDFGPLRTRLPRTVTFFHLKASNPHRLRCCLQDVPATLLPTLVSAFVAETSGDLYLGVNLWLYERCGYDAVRERPLFDIATQDRRMAEAGVATPGARDAACEAAYEQALAAYRRAGIMDPGLGQT